MKLSRAKDDFIAECRIRLAPQTCIGYESDLGLLVSLANVHAADSVLAFTAELVREYFLALSKKGLTMSTLHRRRATLNEFARWGIKRRLWTVNPMDDAPVIKKPKHLPRPFAKGEREALLGLELTDPKDRLLRALLYWTGLRVTPICGIRLGDIALGEPPTPGSIRTMGKGRKPHVVYVVPQLRAVLEDYILRFTNLEPAAYLLAQPSGRPWHRRMVARRTREWGRRAKVPSCTPHRFRHTLATALLEAGAHIRRIQEVLGHADLSSTMIYTQVTDAQVADTMMLLAPTPETPPGEDRSAKITGADSVPRPESAT